jgi:hypothetical protein
MDGSHIQNTPRRITVVKNISNKNERVYPNVAEA